MTSPTLRESIEFLKSHAAWREQNGYGPQFVAAILAVCAAAEMWLAQQEEKGVEVQQAVTRTDR